MEAARESDFFQDQCRWKLEHGHWLKDIGIWQMRHQEACVILEAIAEAMHQFTNQVEIHRATIDHHCNILNLHEEALAWRHEHPPKWRNQIDQEMHKSQAGLHSHERVLHQQLADLHRKVYTNVCKLAEVFEIKT